MDKIKEIADRADMIVCGYAFTRYHHALSPDTTMHYAMVKQQNVKLAHRKYIG